MTDHSALIERPCAATDQSDLRNRIMNPNVAKSEAEWWASREIERLEEALRDLTEWRDIATAPKDGAVIHVFAAGFDWPEAVRWELYEPEDAEEAGEEGYWTYAEDLMADATDSCEPETWTHWRPINLPSALNQAKEAGE